METGLLLPPIPFETAEELCAEIREEANHNWHTLTARWCWRCQRNVLKRSEEYGFTIKPGNRGCILINNKYARRYDQTPAK